METAVCLKIGLHAGEESDSQIIGFYGYDFDSFLQANPTLKLDELISVLLLEHIYMPLGGGFSSYLPDLVVQPVIPIKLGFMHNKITMEGMGDNNSAVGFTEELLKDLLYQELYYLSPDLGESLKGADIETYNNTLSQFGIPLNIFPQKMALRIYECTPEDLADSGGIFKDYFQIIKSFLINKNGFLESQDYEKAIYYPEGNYIEMLSECALIYGGLPPEEPDTPEDVYSSLEIYNGYPNYVKYLNIFSYSINGGDLVTDSFHTQTYEDNGSLAMGMIKRIPNVFDMSEENQTYFATVEEENNENYSMIVLGLLSFHEQAGYEIQQDKNTIEFFATPNEVVHRVYNEFVANNPNTGVAHVQDLVVYCMSSNSKLALHSNVLAIKN